MPAEERERMGEEGGAQMETPELLAHRPLPPVEDGHPGETGRPVPHRRMAGGTRYTRADGGEAVEQPLSSLSEEEVLKRTVAELTAQLSAVRYVTRLGSTRRDWALFCNRFRPCRPRLIRLLFIPQGGAQCAGKRLGRAVRPLPLRQGEPEDDHAQTTPTAPSTASACRPLLLAPCPCRPGLRSVHPHPS